MAELSRVKGPHATIADIDLLRADHRHAALLWRFEQHIATQNQALFVSHPDSRVTMLVNAPVGRHIC